jgi:lipoprotein-anchoring transpeptidase ErfK/SrfK
MKKQEFKFFRSVCALTLVSLFAFEVSTARAATAFQTDNEIDWNEETAGEIAADLDREKNDPDAVHPQNDNPGDRLITPDHFGEYKIVVDVFRQSAKRPVLGKFESNYVDATTGPSKENNPKFRARSAKARFEKLANTEFLVVSEVDDRGFVHPIKANLISGAIESPLVEEIRKGDELQYGPDKKVLTQKNMISTPNGNFKLSVVQHAHYLKSRDGTMTKDGDFDWPFRTSSRYGRSAMFWGLSIFGGYMIHSTPHTSQLGRPASMGCIRQSFPDAMELWDLLENHSEGRKAMVRIHKMHSLEAYTRLREIVYDPTYDGSDPAFKLTDLQRQQIAIPSTGYDLKWLVGQLNLNFNRLHTYMSKYGNVHKGVGFAWVDPVKKVSPKPVFPMCKDKDCFAFWGDPLKQQALDQKNDAIRDAKSKLKHGIVDSDSPSDEH